jgi:IS30 family transposase
MLVQVGMGTIYRQLTSQERDLLGILLAEGHTRAEIGRRLGRSRSTISREIRRNGPRIRKCHYLPHKAESRATKRRQATYGLHKMRDGRIREYVTTGLKSGWSPEIIAGRLSIEQPALRISHETIYQWIYREGRDYRQYLTRRHRRRKRKGEGKKVHIFNIPHRVSIDQRPESIATRTEAGHWEVDTAFFHCCKNVLQVMAERKTRYTMITRLKEITSKEMRTALLKRHEVTPVHLRKSFTYDNGRENVCHFFVNLELGTKSYFCHPGRSYEKGTVENTIGVLRRWLPKKARFGEVPDERLQNIEDWLNNRPRRCLGFKTPREAYEAERCT